MKRMKRLLAVILTAALLLSLYVPTSAAETSGGVDTLLNMDETPPADYDSNLENPYGYPVGQPFDLGTSHELAFFATANEGDTKEYGLKDTNGDSLSNLNSFVKDPKGATESSDFSSASGNWAFVQAVAFDPTGSGRDDHIIFVGLRDKKAYAWVSKVKSGDSKTVSNTLELCSMSWMEDSYEQFQSTSLFDIVAGDFNGDGKDTAVIYTPGSGDKGCTLREVSLSGSTLSSSASSYNLLMDAYFTDSKDVYSDSGSCKDIRRNKLAVSMTASDLNGDNIDDLAVLSYCHRVKKSDVPITYYQPKVKVVYGDRKMSGTAVSQASKSFDMYSESGSEITFPVAASLVSGDFDADTMDELYVVGAVGTATNKSGKVDGHISVSDKKWYLQGIFNYVNSDDGGAIDLLNGTPYTVETNTWWEDGFYSSDDDAWGEVMAEAVAFDGFGAAEKLFVAGSVFDVSSTEPKAKYTASYFNSRDDGAGSTAVSNTFIQDVSVGNFDGNTYGREQVVYTIGLKESGQDDYSYKLGYTAGTFDSTGLPNGYTSSSIGDAKYIHSNKGDNLEQGLNCFTVAIDNDYDGTKAKYIGATYIYTDPEVKAVLQAPPYFAEMSDSSNGTTSYTLSTSYGVGKGYSNSVNYSGGIAGNLTAIYVAVSASLVYAGSWTYSKQTTVTETYSETYTAVTQDTVVVHRTPIIVYLYSLQDEKGNWSEDASMQCMVPQQPVSVTLSVDDYNIFVDEYNGQIEQAIKDNPEYKDDKWESLVKLDLNDNYLNNNEGNPYAYNTSGWSAVPSQSFNGQTFSANAEKLSTSPHSMGYTGGYTQVSWNKSNTTTENTDITNGFSFALTITIGKYTGKVTAGAGVDLGLGYARGALSSKTSGTLIGTSCLVGDIDEDALVKSGVPSNVVRSYGFSWDMLKWERHLSGNTDPELDADDDGEPDGITMTPVVGYYLQNVTSPSLSVTDLKADAISATEVALTWSKPQQYYGWPDISGYKIYVVTSDGSPYKLIKTVGANETQAVITDQECKDAGYTSGLAAGGTDSFVVTSYHTSTGGAENESVWSNKVTVTMPDNQYTLTYAADNPSNADVIAYEYGDSDEEFVSGEEVPEGTTVTVKATPKDTNCEILGFEVYRDSTSVPFLETQDSVTGAKYCTFPVNGYMSVKVLTKGSTSTVEYADKIYVNVPDGDATKPVLIGEVSAESGGSTFISGSSIVHDGSVTFTAKPEDGYKLTGWSIEQWNGDETPVTTYVNVPLVGGDNTYTLSNPTYDNYKVTAQFGQKIITNPTITVNAVEGNRGSIILTDKNGNTIPTDGGKVTVPFGSLITFTAQPSLIGEDDAITGKNTFKKWSGALEAEQSSTVTLRVISDMTVGAEFDTAKLFEVSSSVEGAGTVSVSPERNAENKLDEGTEVSVIVKADAGSYIDKVVAEVSDGSGSKEILFELSKEDGYKTVAAKRFTLKENVSIVATFEKIPEKTVKVSATSTDNDSVTILQNGKDVGTPVNAKLTDTIVIIATAEENFAPVSNKEKSGEAHPEWVYAGTNEDKKHQYTLDYGSDWDEFVADDASFTVNVEFAELWNVSAAGNDGGYIIGNLTREKYDYVRPESSVLTGDNVEFMVIPKENYKISEVSVSNPNGIVTALGNGARLVKIPDVQETITVAVKTLKAVNLTNSKKLEEAATNHGFLAVRNNGKLVRDGAVLYTGDVLTVTAHPLEGYQNGDITVNNAPLTGDSFTVGTSDVGVDASFDVIKFDLPQSTTDYTVTQITPATGTTVNWGDPAEFTIEPQNGKKIVSVEVNNSGTASQDKTENGTSSVEPDKEPTDTATGETAYTLEDTWTVTIPEVKSKIELTVTTANCFDLTVNTVENGEIFVLRGDDAVLDGVIYEGETLTVSGEPAEGYQLGTVYINGEKISGTTFTVEGNTEVSAEFVEKPAGGGGTGGGEDEGGEDTCPKDETCPISKFTDSSPTAWYHDGVHYALVNGLMQGTSDTTFSPRVDTSRAMLVTMLYRLEGEPEVSGENPFSDVPEHEYYYAPIMWAVENEIVLGYADGTYKPGRAIDRQDFAVIMYRYAQYKGYDVSSGDSFTITGYKDADEIGDYALTAMQWAVCEGLLQGVSETELILDPLGSTIRAQTATIFQRFCEKYMTE